MFDRLVAVLERWLLTDVRYLVKGVSWLTIGQIVSSGASFVAALAFANLLTPETYGVYRYMLAAGAILAIPALGGINTALVQAIAAHKEGTVHTAFYVKLRYALIGSCIALVGSGYYFYQGNETLGACFALLAVTMPLMEAFGLFDSLLQGRQDFKRSVMVDACLQVIVMAGVVSVIVLFKDPVAIVGAYFILWTVGRIVAWYYVRRVAPLRTTAEDPRTVPFGWHLSIMGAAGTAAQYADQVLLFQHIGAAELALYSIALAIPEQFKNSFRGIFSLLLPRYSSQGAESIRATIWYKTKLLSVVAILMTLGYIALIPWALPFFFPKYAHAVFYTQLISLTFITSISGIFTTALQALHRTKELYIYNFLFPLVQIVFVLIGILFYGVLGAVLARVATRFVMCGAAIVLYQRSR